ncbi:MAG: hypothetical protein AAGD14_10665 [Planctomycetota bacterium]
MRVLTLLLFASVLVAQDSAVEEDEQDEFGFPIIFDTDIITKDDLLRSRGLERIEQLGNIRSARDIFLRNRLQEKLVEIYDLAVTDREVDDWINLEFAKFESEADFYEDLLQRGLTLEEKRLTIKRGIQNARLQSLLVNGYVGGRAGNRLLPWDPVPTPREVRIAFDRTKPTQAVGRVSKWREMVVTLPDDERKSIVRKKLFGDKDDDWLNAELAKALKPRMDKATALLKEGKSFDEVALAVDSVVEVVEQEIPKAPSRSLRLAFVQSAEKGARSDPIDIGQGRFLFMELVETRELDAITLNDPEIVQQYFIQIQQLKSEKARLTLLLRALDRSIVRPARVQTKMREGLRRELGQVHGQLRRLGLH